MFCHTSDCKIQGNLSLQRIADMCRAGEIYASKRKTAAVEKGEVQIFKNGTSDYK